MKNKKNTILLGVAGALILAAIVLALRGGSDDAPLPETQDAIRQIAEESKDAPPPPPPEPSTSGRMRKPAN